MVSNKNEGSVEYIIRMIRDDEVDLLQDFLYEAIFIPEGVCPPSRDILKEPQLRVYTDDFGKKKGDLCVVAASEGKLIGAVWTRIMNDYGHVDDATPSLAIAVLGEYRGQGIGSKLMARILDLLKLQRYERVSLSVQKANEAVKLYEDLGFQTIDETDEEHIMVYEL